ncbi:MAG: hypothetical protein ACT6S0_24380 [Roseateles sp.]|uniref:hypothetical protein n=1 Tax=Roseateles sp. TaxID=1971397 RepID=UPI00403709E6
MLFLLALILVVSYAIASFFSLPRTARGLRIGMGAVAVLTALTFVFATDLFAKLFFHGAIAGDAINWTPILAFAAGIGALLVFTYESTLWAHAGSQWGNDRPLAKGRRVLSGVGIALGIYLAFTAIDHWWFFRGDDAGFAAADFVGADEVPCEVALVRVDGDALAFRCPTALTFNVLYGTPFVPWPEYTTGRSVEFKNKIDEMMREASRP